MEREDRRYTQSDLPDMLPRFFPRDATRLQDQ